mmetsp:Transcript_26586/g.76792  ORF Transcript_26586/g.76792 Transcript_26586/m.76792 type:complete len:157 (+) Transcript_26586:82-552(+)
MINRLITPNPLRPMLQRVARKAQKSVRPAVVISSSRGRPFTSTGFEEPASNARGLDDYEQVMGPAPAISWIEEAVRSTTIDLRHTCTLTGWSSSPLPPVETTSTTMGLENIFFDNDNGDDDDLAATAGYRTQCSFETDAEDRDYARPGVDSPANEV